MENIDNTFHAKRYMDITDSYKSERWCDDCWLLKNLCICRNISTIEILSRINFHLYIHYKEYKKTSNTGILIKKLFSNSGVYIAGVEEQRQALIKRVESSPNVCVLYPGEKSLALEDWLATNSPGPKDFILLDSTWNQGRKLLNSLPDTYPRVKLVSVSTSLIKCKKQANKGYLSTLECVAYILKELGETQAFESVMSAFILKDKAALKQTNKHSLLKSLEENKHYELG
jgi:DTW domain-containing protein YfiP